MKTSSSEHGAWRGSDPGGSGAGARSLAPSRRGSRQARGPARGPGRRRRPGLALAAGLIWALAAGSGPAVANSDGPLPGFTGGFGQATCRSCHFDAPEEPEEGELVLEGVPADYRPGRSYPLTVVLRHPELARGGFQLTARFAEGTEEGRQAGILRVPDGDGGEAPPVEVVEAGSRTPLLYARQTVEGAAPAPGHEVRWDLEWVAPADAGAPVAFHAAGNAANHDDSEFGDVVLTATARSEPGDGPR